MAEEIQIHGTQSTAKIRSPWAPALLPFITLGIYHLVWYYRINREMRDLGRANGTKELGESPLVSLLAVAIGWVIIVPAVLSTIRTFQRIQRAQRLNGVQMQANGWLALILVILIPPAFYAYEQSELNKAWRQQGATAAVPPPPPPPPAPLP